jgi:hypothetical protein
MSILGLHAAGSKAATVIDLRRRGLPKGLLACVTLAQPDGRPGDAPNGNRRVKSSGHGMTPCKQGGRMIAENGMQARRGWLQAPGAAPRQAALVALVERARGRVQHLVADEAAEAAAEHVPHARRRPLQRAHLAPGAQRARPSGPVRARLPRRRPSRGKAGLPGLSTLRRCSAGSASAHRAAGSVADPQLSQQEPPEDDAHFGRAARMPWCR